MYTNIVKSGKLMLYTEWLVFVCKVTIKNTTCGVTVMIKVSEKVKSYFFYKMRAVTNIFTLSDHMYNIAHRIKSEK